jgi:Na+/proline symporter
MVLAWMVIRKMIRIAGSYRITSIADFIGSRYGKRALLAGLVTVITVIGIVPCIALQIKAMSVGYSVLTTAPGQDAGAHAAWWSDSTLYFALALAGFTVVFGQCSSGLIFFAKDKELTAKESIPDQSADALSADAR